MLKHLLESYASQKPRGRSSAHFDWSSCMDLFRDSWQVIGDFDLFASAIAENTIKHCQCKLGHCMKVLGA